MKPLQMIPSFFAVYVWHWEDMRIENFGVQRAPLISPLRDALQLGLVFTLYIDTPAIALNLMGSVWYVAVRRTKDGVLPGEKKHIDIYEALCVIAQCAARQYHEEDQKGTLEVDKLVDPAVLDQNPLGIPAKEMRSTQVPEAWKEGTCMYRRQIQESQNT